MATGRRPAHLQALGLVRPAKTCIVPQHLYSRVGRIMSAIPPLPLSYFLPETSRQGPSIYKAFQIAQIWVEFVLGS